MSQTTQQYHKTGTDLQALPDTHTTNLSGQVDTLKIVACPICRATYLPSNEQNTRDSTSLGLLETAFLGISRFCFRCQRPACPQCWNPIHHVCASCSEEAHLPFRAPVPSLEGLVFLPSTSAHARTANTISFTCKRNGRFYTPEPALTYANPQELPLARPHSPAISEPGDIDELPTVPPKLALPAQEPRELDHYPLWLQEVLGQKVEEQSALSANENTQIDHPATRYAQSELALSAPAYTPGQNWPQMAPMAQTQTAPAEPSAPSAPTGYLLSPTEATPVARQQSEPVFEDDTEDESSLFERIENTLIIITSILLLAVVLMIVLSIVSAQVNTFFLHLFHIDIRTEIAYLLQLR